MDPFYNNPIRGNLKGDGNPHDPVIINEGAPWAGIDTDWKPSWPERLVGKGAGVLQKFSILVLSGAGLAIAVALFVPFIRFLYEFSSWLYDQVGRIFW